MSGQTDLWTLLVIVAMGAITALARSFFFLSKRPWTLPDWAQRGLAYAPIAALSAVVLPEIVMTQGQLIGSWSDARIYAAAAACAYFFARRIGAPQRNAVLGTIIAGMAVYLPLKLGLGW